MNDIIWEAATFLLELIKLLPIMYFVLHFKFKSLKKIILISIIIFIVFMICCFWGIVEIIYVGAYLCLAYCILILKGKYKTLCTIITYIAISILDMLSASISLLLLNYDYNTISNKPIANFFTNSISLIIILVIVILTKISNKSNAYFVNTKTNILYLILFLLGEISLGAFVSTFQIYSDNINDSGRKIMAVALSIGSVIFLLVGVVLFVNYISKNYYKSTSKINEKLLESQEKYYTMMLNKDLETIRFRHDIINHINCMYLLLNRQQYNELKEYFDKMGASLSELKSQILIGNDMISAILNDISLKYPEVKIDIDGKLPTNLNLSNIDICTIFSNLFENAFFAANQTNEKTVKISIKVVSQNLCFEIINTVLHKVEIINNEMITQKSDKINHGYGTLNAKKCAEINGCSIYFYCTDYYFTTEFIMLNAII